MLDLTENSPDKVTVLDVRKPEELIDSGCIKGAKCIPRKRRKKNLCLIH